jgi:OPT family oligopeptide transporter
MGIPAKLLFKLQLAATVIASFTQIGVLNWMLANIPAICTPEAPNGLTCPLARVHFNGSVLWGVIGPLRFFGPGELYRPLVWAFVAGAFAPLIPWYLSRRATRNGTAGNNGHWFWSKVNLPVLFGSLSWIPPATALNFSVWFAICYIFNYKIKRQYYAWWSKYTMTLSAALDSGLAVGVVIIFFGLVYPGFTDGFKWWGTEVYKKVCDTV